jgi:hypothetical protein
MLLIIPEDLYLYDISFTINEGHTVSNRNLFDSYEIQRILGCMFLKPEDLQNVRVSSLLSLVANTGLGLIS